MSILTTAPFWLSGLLLVVLPTLLAMIGPVVVRRSVPLEALISNNEVAGFKFAVVGVLYSVLIGFSVIVVWERFSDSEANVAQEAGAAVTILRLSDGLDADARAGIRARLSAYLTDAIEEDWPAMAQGREGAGTTTALDQLYAEVLGLNPITSRDDQILYELLYQLDQLTQARRDRLVAAAGIVPGVLWLVLFGGGLLTVGFTFFFGNRNIVAQSAMTGILALLISSALLVVVVIDRPFAGGVHVTPEALEAVLAEPGL